MKNRNIREKLKVLWRGIKAVQRMEPRLLPADAAAAVFRSFSPFVTIVMSAMIIDELFGARSVKRLVFLVLMTVGLNFAVHIISAGLDRMIEVFDCRFGYMVSIRMSTRIITTDYENVENPDFHTKLQKIQEYRNMGGSGLWSIPYQFRELIQAFFSAAFAVALAFPLFLPSKGAGNSLISSPWLTAALFALLVLSSLYTIFSNSKATKVMMGQMNRFIPLNRVYFFYINLMMDSKFGKDVRLYREQKILQQTFEYFGGGTVKVVSRAGNLQGRLTAVNAAISNVIGGAVYLFVGLRALAGLFSIGSVVQYVGAISQFTSGLSQFISVASQFWMNGEYVALYLDFIGTPDKMYSGTLPVEKRSDNQYEIEFRHVSFRYPGADRYALKDFSLRLKIGEHLAVVGRNGSGKTTFIKLLCRLYDPTEGEILLNGINIKKYDYNEYLSLFSVVFQDFKLFAFSAGQNVASDVEYDRSRAAAALDEAGAGERIRSLPKGIDTPLYKVDDDGVEISGGEAQKIALARALYKDAPFIVLDEPTAALDPIAEYDVYSKFNGMVGSKTAVYISHRLSSCRFCSDIAVFREGRLIQRGSHDELIKDENGEYYELWNAQAQYYNEKREYAEA